jgi:putative transport protein
MAVPGRVSLRRMVVTRRDVVGSTLADASIALGGAVTFTRLRRGGVELTARPDHRLRFGDLVWCVGADADLDAAARHLGNADSALSATEFLPIFIGLALGLVVGAVSVPIAGLPAPLKLGLAGGPLLVAIVLGRVGRVGPVLWYMPGNVNVALRELGMTLFLAAVGLKAGAHLVGALTSGTGPLWFGVGVVVTVVPILIVGVIGRALLKLDYPTLSGVLAGSMTDPPALAFAQGLAGSDAPAVGYAAVYPLTMVLRIVTAQLLVLLLS